MQILGLLYSGNSVVSRWKSIDHRAGACSRRFWPDCFSQICNNANLEQLVVGSSPIQKNEKNGAHKAVCRFDWISRLRNLLRNSPQDCFSQICLRQIWSSLSLVRVTTEIKENRYAYAYRFSFGSPSWTRTNDPAVNSRMLYQLSYWGISTFIV